MTPAKVLEAKNLITRGTVYQLGRTYESGMPMFGTRHFSLRIPGAFGPNGSNQMMYHDEIISVEIAASPHRRLVGSLRPPVSAAL